MSLWHQVIKVDYDQLVEDVFDERASSQGSQDANQAKDLALGKAKLPSCQGTWPLLKFSIQRVDRSRSNVRFF
jgi:hypothetical protein